MYIDCHKKYLEDAKEEILKSLSLCKKIKDPYLDICHGYNSGRKIKDWILETDFPQVSQKLEMPNNSGVTRLYLKQKLK